MKTAVWFFLLVCSIASVAPVQAQVQVLSDEEPQRVFSGDGRKISLGLRNTTERTQAAHLRLSLYQASSVTAMPLGEQPWKSLELLPGQTVLESATLAFPPVKAETRFVVKWLAGSSNEVAGTTDVWVYPTNLLQELKALGGEYPLGVLDPQGELKPLLKAAAVEYVDLGDTALENYPGKLAIIGPFQSSAQMQEGLPHRLKVLAHKGVAVVWLLPRLQPPPQKPYALTPSFYTVTEGKGAVVVAQANLVASLAESPEAQLNLLALARRALHPLPYPLPQLPSSP
ncbi:MAG: hypothetical protein ACTHLW_15805 [Verrucomicrobiota bacterium]